MKYENFLKNNLVKKANPDPDQIRLQIERSERDLETAEANLEGDR